MALDNVIKTLQRTQDLKEKAIEIAEKYHNMDLRGKATERAVEYREIAEQILEIPRGKKYEEIAGLNRRLNKIELELEGQKLYPDFANYCRFREQEHSHRQILGYYQDPGADIFNRWKAIYEKAKKEDEKRKGKLRKKLYKLDDSTRQVWNEVKASPKRNLSIYEVEGMTPNRVAQSFERLEEKDIGEYNKGKGIFIPNRLPIEALQVHTMLRRPSYLLLKSGAFKLIEDTLPWNVVGCLCQSDSPMSRAALVDKLNEGEGEAGANHVGVALNRVKQLYKRLRKGWKQGLEPDFTLEIGKCGSGKAVKRYLNLPRLSLEDLRERSERIERNWKNEVRRQTKEKYWEQLRGSQVREIRKKLELTQKQLGKILGVVPETVSRWETEVIYPTKEHLRKLQRLQPLTEE